MTVPSVMPPTWPTASARTDDGADGVADVAQLGGDGHDDVGKAVGLLGAFLQLVVGLAETGQRFLLVGKHLDDLLALHHFLNVAVQLAQIPLLGNEILAGLGGDLFGGPEHQGHAEQGDAGKADVQQAHAHQYGYDGDGAGNELRDALAQHLAQGVHIVGVHGHDIAVGVGVKVGDGQALHVGEELDAQVAQGALGDIDHDAGVAPRGQDADEVDAAHMEQGPGQRGKIRVGLLSHGDDVIVHQRLQKQAGLHIGKGAGKDAAEHEDAVGQVMPEHFCHDPPEQLAGIFHLGARAAHAAGAGAVHHFCFGLCHYCSPPCLSKSPPPWVWLL